MGGGRDVRDGARGASGGPRADVSADDGGGAGAPVPLVAPDRPMPQPMVHPPLPSYPQEMPPREPVFFYEGAPVASPGDEPSNRDARQNVRESNQYEALVRSNPSFRARRMSRNAARSPTRKAGTSASRPSITAGPRGRSDRLKKTPPRACPGGLRLYWQSARHKTWMAGPSPATGSILVLGEITTPARRRRGAGRRRLRGCRAWGRRGSRTPRRRARQSRASARSCGRVWRACRRFCRRSGLRG